MNVIRFEISNAESYDVNRLPRGVDGEKQLMMWKELCRVGQFTDADGVEHNINRAFLQNIVKTFFDRKAKGIEVPCPVGHTHDPESKRGKVVYLELRGDDSACSLYGIIEFIDEDAKSKLCHSNVSIEAPDYISDGDGTTYRYALEHVAFTDYPVVAGLEQFTDVIFSLTKEPDNMAKKQFSDDEEDKKLSKKRRFSDDIESKKVDDEDTKMSCRRRFSDDEKEDEDDEDDEPKKFSKSRKRYARDDEDEAEEKRFNDTEDAEDEEEEDEEEEKKFSRKGKKFSLSGNGQVLATIRENRSLKIEGLARDGKITPSQAEAMEGKYCTRSSIRFSLDSGADDGFEFACRLMNMNPGVEFGEKTNVQFSNDRNQYQSERIENDLEKEFQRKWGKK